jgi:hypothetical protein
MWTTDNSVHTKLIKLVLQFYLHIMQQRDFSLYTDNMSRRIVCRTHTRVAQKVDLLQILSNGIATLISNVRLY